MTQAKNLLEYLSNCISDLDDELYSSMICSAVISYARCFGKSYGIGKLKLSYSEFSEDDLKEYHKSIITFRDGVYAHRDAVVEHGGSEIESEIFWRINNEEIEFKPIMPELPLSIPEFIRLVNFQIERVYKDISKKIESLNIINPDTGNEWHKLQIT